MPPVPAPGGTSIAGPPRPLGDPDGLRVLRDALIGPTTGMISFGLLIDGQAQVHGWTGPAADAFTGRMHEVANRLRAASHALGQGEQALTSLSESLRQAQELWDLAQAVAKQGPGGGGLQASAEEVASSAYSLAKRQFDDAAHRLTALTHQSQSPLPKPMVCPINPCGLIPEEAASAFWNQGMMPINTGCVGVVEVTIDVDGMPVETFEAVPIAPDTNESKPKGGGKDQAQSPEDKLLIRARIRRQLAAGTSGEKLEAQVGQHLLGEGRQLFKFHDTIWAGGRPVGDIDVEADQAIIEVTEGPDDKLGQAMKLRSNRYLNPQDKPVVVYAPNYSQGGEDALKRAGIPLARSLEQLSDLLDSLGG